MSTMATTYTDRLGAALRLFDGCRGTVVLSGRSLHGFGEQGAHVTPPFKDTPLPVLQLLADGYSLRVSPVTRNGQALAELPMVWVLWRPTTLFNKATRWQHTVDPDAQAQIAQALSTMPPPSLLVDAGPEAWAAWRLQAPFDLRRQTDAAQAALVALAQRLGGDMETAEDPTATLPLAGRIRNWGATPDYITIVVAEPERTYRIEEITRAGRAEEALA